MNRRMETCEGCGGFLPTAASCPNCGRRPGPALLRALAGIGGGSALAVVLAACYGVPYDEGMLDAATDGYTRYCNDMSMDLDGDAYCGEYDCDESDPDRHALAPDPVGDGIDQDCDGVDGTM